MILTTAENFGLNYEIVGLVQSTVCLSSNVVQDTAATLKNLMGGEISSYSSAMETACEMIVARMSEKAKAMGADMIIGVRYQSANIITGAVGLIGYGTAIKTLT